MQRLLNDNPYFLKKKNRFSEELTSIIKLEKNYFITRDIKMYVMKSSIIIYSRL